MKDERKQNRWRTIVEILLLLAPFLTLFFTHDERWGFWLAALCLLNLAAWLLVRHFSKKEGPNQKIAQRVELFVPAVEYGLILAVCAGVFHEDFDSSQLILILLGLLFVVLGNWMPQIEQNSTLGIRTSWSMVNRENWNYTNRMGGFAYVVGGLLCWLCVLLRLPFWTGFLIILIMTFFPVLFSRHNYLQQVREGTWKAQTEKNATPKWVRVITILLLAGAAVILILVFTVGGSYEISPAQEEIVVTCRLDPGIRIDYGDIQSVELVKAGDAGQKVFGYAFNGTDLGRFKNAEYGTYSRFTSKSPVAIRIVKKDGDVVIVSDKTEDSTKTLFEQISRKISDPE